MTDQDESLLVDPDKLHVMVSWTKDDNEPGPGRTWAAVCEFNHPSDFDHVKRIAEFHRSTKPRCTTCLEQLCWAHDALRAYEDR